LQWARNFASEENFRPKSSIFLLIFIFIVFWMKKRKKPKRKVTTTNFLPKSMFFQVSTEFFVLKIDVFVAFLIFYGSIDMSICPA